MRIFILLYYFLQFTSSIAQVGASNAAVKNNVDNLEAQPNEKTLDEAEILAAQKLVNNSKFPVFENGKTIEQATQHRNKIVARYLQEGEIEKAKKLLLSAADSTQLSPRLIQFLWKDALNHIDENNQKIAYSYYYSAWILALENKLKSAVQAAEMAIQSAELDNNLALKAKCHLMLSNLYAEMNLPTLSIFHTDKLNSMLMDKKGFGNGFYEILKNNIAIIMAVFIAIMIILLLGYFFIFKDSSKKTTKIFQENKDINGELLKSNQIKDKLFAVLAHDLRAPVNSLTGMLDVINSDLVDEKKKKEMLKKLRVELSNSSAMLNNLLGWAKGQILNPQPRIEKIDLREIFDSNISLLKSFADAKGVEISNNSSEKMEANGDKEMLNIIVRNLVQNAIKYTDTGDKIILDTEYDFSKEEVRIKVTDNGKGMTAEKLGKLFDLESLSEPGTRNETGSGLGLILCKEFAEAQGGRMWAESKEGYGSVFYFTLKSAS